MTAAQLCLILAAIFGSRLLSERSRVWWTYLWLVLSVVMWVVEHFFMKGGA